MRYILDERVGCAAVIDTKHPGYDPEYPGLNPDTKGVVLYEAFTNKSNLNISKYEIEEGRLVVERLKKDCKTLNDTAPRTKTEFVKCVFECAWHAIKAFEDGEELYTKRSHKDFVLIDNAPDVLRFLYDLHRKVETEIDERQGFIDTAVELLNQNSHDHEANHYKEWFGDMFDSGKFKLVE